MHAAKQVLGKRSLRNPDLRNSGLRNPDLRNPGLRKLAFVTPGPPNLQNQGSNNLVNPHFRAIGSDFAPIVNLVACLH
jgi:hypothetical protein